MLATVSGKFILGILGLVAEFERQIIAQRTAAGIAAFRARKRKDGAWGPKVFMTPDRIKRVGKLLNGGMSGPAVAKEMGISVASVYGFWKQAGPGEFVRKAPKDRGPERRKRKAQA